MILGKETDRSMQKMINTDSGYPLITSRKNPLIIRISSLYEKKFREKLGLFAFEGIKLLRDAIEAGAEIEHIMIREDASERVIAAVPALPMNKISLVSESVYSKISKEKSPEGVLCVIKRIDFLHKFVRIYSNEEKKSGTRFMAAQIRDPGNLGTMIRSANALGIDELIISSDCADLYNERTVRASMGALFRQRITVCDDIAASVDALKGDGYCVMAATLNKESVKLTDIRVEEKTCFLVGNEGHGLDDSLVSHCDGSVIIPMKAGSESLNAAIAAAILMWEIGKGS